MEKQRLNGSIILNQDLNEEIGIPIKGVPQGDLTQGMLYYQVL